MRKHRQDEIMISGKAIKGREERSELEKLHNKSRIKKIALPQNSGGKTAHKLSLKQRPTK